MEHVTVTQGAASVRRGGLKLPHAGIAQVCNRTNRKQMKKKNEKVKQKEIE